MAFWGYFGVQKGLFWAVLGLFEMGLKWVYHIV